MTEQSPARMSNRDFARVFKTIGDLMEIKGENIYKILAYRRAADSLTNLGQDVNELWRAGQLEEIPGVGKAIAEKIDEMLKTGRLGFLERLTAEVPASLAELLNVPDLGPKKVALFWKQAGVTTLAELESAAREGRLRGLPGVGEKSEAKILAGIQALGRRSTRIPLGRAWPFAQNLLAWLRTQPGVEAAELGGSLRRMRSTIGDLDLVAATNDPLQVMEAFVHHPQVLNVLAQGDTKSSVEFQDGVRAQLWLHKPEQFGTSWQYATGSKEHSVRLRERAQQMGLSLSDRSIIQPDGSEKFYATEEEVYAALGMVWVPPELREDRGEVQAALNGKLPHLIERSDIRAELHSHSTWSDGQMTVLQMAEAARERGLKVLAITDHSPSLGVTGGLSVDELAAQRAEIDEAQRALGDSILLLQGNEVEIRTDGSLDYPDEALARLDFVIASLHTGLRQPREQVTRRLIRAIQNPHVDLIGHPTGRLIPEREGADLDMEAVLAAAKESGVALEINAHPSRLDLEDIYARRAAGMGIPLAINTDAHHPADLDLLPYGIATARRGWIEPEQVINTWSDERLVDWLKKRG